MLKIIARLLTLIVMAFLVSCWWRPPAVEATVRAMNRGQIADAYRYAQMAIEEYPENAEAWFYWGWLNGEYKKDFDEMNKAFVKAIALNPTKKFKNADSSVTLSESTELLRKKFYVEIMNPAISAVMTARELANNDPDKPKLIEDAIEKLLIAKHVDPLRDETYAPLVVAYLLTGDTAQAIKTVLAGIEVHPQNVKLHLRAGDIFMSTGNDHEAMMHYYKAAEIHYDLYSKAIDLQPEDITLSYNIGVSLYERQQYRKAIPYFVNVVEWSQEEKETRKFLSSCYVQSNMPDEGITFLEKTTKLYPNEPFFWEYLAHLYDQKGMSDKADAAYQKYESLRGER